AAMVKSIIALIIAAAVFNSCSLDRQARALKALEKCRYEFVSADSVLLAGTDVTELVADGRIDVGRLPGIALGFLSRDIPLSGILNVRITNPTTHLAGIQQFMYKIAVDGKEVMDGTSDRPIQVHGGETVVVPIKLQTNVYKFLSDRETLNKLVTFVENARNGSGSEDINLTFSIKPTLALGNQQINYPGYISFDKRVNAEMQFRRAQLR